MFQTTILDVAIGLVFMFLGISLIVSAITEGVASMVNWRARTLLAGVQSLLNDPNFTALAKDLYYHALINPLAAAPSPAQAQMPAGERWESDGRPSSLEERLEGTGTG